MLCRVLCVQALEDLYVHALLFQMQCMCPQLCNQHTETQ
jgi:hypothetical protein